jgi:choline dehydrogenase
MTGEKAADHILGRRLPPSDLRPWTNPRWRDSDR